jgi:hypothetical protein
MSEKYLLPGSPILFQNSWTQIKDLLVGKPASKARSLHYYLLKAMQPVVMSQEGGDDLYMVRAIDGHVVFCSRIPRWTDDSRMYTVTSKIVGVGVLGTMLKRPSLICCGSLTGIGLRRYISRFS